MQATRVLPILMDIILGAIISALWIHLFYRFLHEDSVKIAGEGIWRAGLTLLLVHQSLVFHQMAKPPGYREKGLFLATAEDKIMLLYFCAGSLMFLGAAILL